MTESRRTAIVHLDRKGPCPSPRAVTAALAPARGVRGVQFEPRDRLLVVRFDRRDIGMADIVRLIEDAGMIVSSLAVRRPDPARALATGMPARLPPRRRGL